VIINEDDNGKWTLQSESTLKNMVYEFIPGVELNETRAHAAEVKVSVKF
jgi:hypothetical protein